MQEAVAQHLIQQTVLLPILVAGEVEQLWITQPVVVLQPLEERVAQES
jgi:hypothetical protein